MNSAAGNAGTVHPLVRTERGSLQLRVLSAVTLAPFPIAAIWFGWPWLPLLTAIAAAVMAWEWGRLCRRGQFGQTGIVLVAVVLAVVAAAAHSAHYGWRCLASVCFGWRATDRSAAPPFYGYSQLSGRPISVHTQSGGCSVARAWRPVGAHGKLGLGLPAALAARRWRGGLPLHGLGSLRQCHWCSSAQALRLSGSSAILPNPWLSEGSA